MYKELYYLHLNVYISKRLVYLDCKIDNSIFFFFEKDRMSNITMTLM